MSLYKKLLILPLCICLSVLCACGADGTDTGDTAPHEITTPFIQQGVLSDDVQGRFLKSGDSLYYAASDSIQLYDGAGCSLVVTADTPSYLSIRDGKLIYLCVSERVNYKPSRREIRSYDLTDGSVEILASGNIDFIACSDNAIYYTEALSDMKRIAFGAAETLFSGELSLPFRSGNMVYLGIDGALCELDLTSGVYTMLLDKCFPQNIFASGDLVYYCSEDNLQLASYNTQSGGIEYLTVNNYGLTAHDGELYYIVNDGGFFIVRVSDGERVISLGSIQNSSAPFFDGNWVYLLISSDDYYGLARCAVSGGAMEKLSQSQG